MTLARTTPNYRGSLARFTVNCVAPPPNWGETPFASAGHLQSAPTIAKTRDARWPHRPAGSRNVG